MIVVSITVAKRDFARLVRAVESGGVVVITRRGRPVARLIGLSDRG